MATCRRKGLEQVPRPRHADRPSTFQAFGFGADTRRLGESKRLDVYPVYCRSRTKPIGYPGFHVEPPIRVRMPHVQPRAVEPRTRRIACSTLQGGRATCAATARAQDSRHANLEAIRRSARFGCRAKLSQITEAGKRFFRRPHDPTLGPWQHSDASSRLQRLLQPQQPNTLARSAKDRCPARRRGQASRLIPRLERTGPCAF